METPPAYIILFLVVTIIVIVAVLTLLIILIFINQKRQRTFEESLAALKLENEKAILKTQVEIQEQTFHDIAREIHDNISLSLTLAKLNLNTTDNTSMSTMKESIDRSIGLITDSINSLSDISRGLNSDLIQQQGLIKALTTETKRIHKSAHIDINLVITGEPVFLPGAEELFIFRIVQESLNNVLKHADATTIDLLLHYDKQKVHVTIKDDGIGFDKDILKAKNGSTAGLCNIENRTKFFNGTLELTTETGKGTQLCVSIPYVNEQN